MELTFKRKISRKYITWFLRCMYPPLLKNRRFSGMKLLTGIRTRQFYSFFNFVKPDKIQDPRFCSERRDKVYDPLLVRFSSTLFVLLEITRFVWFSRSLSWKHSMFWTKHKLATETLFYRDFLSSYVYVNFSTGISV